MIPVIKDMEKTIEKCTDNVKLFFQGYDAAVEDMLNLLDNLDVYEGLETIFSEGIADVTGDKAERMKKAMKDWADMSKNEVLVAFCDEHEIDTEYMTWNDFAEVKEE